MRGLHDHERMLVISVDELCRHIEHCLAFWAGNAVQGSVKEFWEMFRFRSEHCHRLELKMLRAMWAG